MPSKEFLLEQIARAKRFAAAMNSKDDQERFEKMAADYQTQLDAAEITAPAVATEIPSSDDMATTGEAAPSDAIASESENAPTSTDDQQETKD